MSDTTQRMSEERLDARRIALQASLDATGGVCPGCGGEVTPIETVDNSNHPTFWAGCLRCSVFTNPVPRTVFDISDRLVQQEHETYYSHHRDSDDPDEHAYWLDSQRSGMSRLVNRILHLAGDTAVRHRRYEQRGSGGMSDVVECPYCLEDNDVSPDWLSEGVLEFDQTCEECGQVFVVNIEFYESYRGSKSEAHRD